MSDDMQSTALPESPSAVNIDRILQVLTLEYQNLNAQIIARLSARYQFLGFLTAGAAILAAASGQPAFSSGTWVLGALAAAVLVSGIFLFWYLGRTIALQTVYLAEIEERINKLVPGESVDSPRLLSWELDQRSKNSIASFIAGFRPLPQRGGKVPKAARTDTLRGGSAGRSPSASTEQPTRRRAG